MGDRTEYYRDYYRSHPEIRDRQREYVRRWNAAQKAWLRAKLSNPWLGARATTAHKRAYMKKYRRERRLWAALDLRLDDGQGGVSPQFGEFGIHQDDTGGGTQNGS